MTGLATHSVKPFKVNFALPLDSDLSRRSTFVLGWCAGDYVGLLRSFQRTDQAFLLHGGLLKF